MFKLRTRAATIPRNLPVVVRQAAVLDKLAVGASAACLVHCLALPVLVVVLPALARPFVGTEVFHVALLAFAIPTSAVALYGGWRDHAALLPVVVGICGLALMTLGVVAASAAVETALTVFGTMLVATAHLANWRLRRKPLATNDDML